MTHTDRLVTLVASMLTGNSAPSDQLIAQCVLLASVALKQIEAAQ